jgi:hypothetical protein
MIPRYRASTSRRIEGPDDDVVHPGAPRGFEAQLAILDDQTALGAHAEPLCCQKEALGARFAVRDVFGRDNDFKQLAHADSRERTLDTLSGASGGDRDRMASMKAARKFCHLDDRFDLCAQLFEKAALSCGDEVRVEGLGELLAQFDDRALHCHPSSTHKQGPSELEGRAAFGKCVPPGDEVSWHRIGERPIAVEDEALITFKVSGRRKSSSHRRPFVTPVSGIARGVGILAEACFPICMKEMIATLIKKADLSEAQAAKVAEVVRQFLKDKLPDAMEGPVLAALNGDNVDDAVGQAKNLLSKLF